MSNHLTSIRFRFMILFTLLCMPSLPVSAQKANDSLQTAPADSAVATEAAPPPAATNLVEQVYESRIASLEDTLFLSREQLDAAQYLAGQGEKRITALTDSLTMADSAAQQLSAENSALKDTITAMGETGMALQDSINALMQVVDQQAAEIQQFQSQLSILGDSLVQFDTRVAALTSIGDSTQTLSDSLQARGDTLLAQFAATLDSLTQTRGELTANRDTVQQLRDELTLRQTGMAGMYDQLKVALSDDNEILIDSTVDAQKFAYLTEIAGYTVASRGFGRLLGGDSNAEIGPFKLDEFKRYFAWAELEGHTPDVLILLARTHLAMNQKLRGTLVFLKALFIYPNTDAGLVALEELNKLIKKDSELGHVFYEVALNPDSMNVGEENFYRYLHFLDHIRQLENPTARLWYIEECQSFLALFPGIFQADRLLRSVAESYHALAEYHNELLIYGRIRAQHPASSYIPDVTFAIARVTADDLKLFAKGAAGYRQFREEFPRHEQAPAALMAEAGLYESEIKNYGEAINLYRLLGDRYADDPLAPIALFQLARLHNKELKNPSQALTIYEEILANYGDDLESGIPALEGLGAISVKTKQYEAAVVYYLDIHQRYPESNERAVKAILEAADIYESNLKNLDAAIHTLHLVLDNYPDYPGIKSVRKRVDKLQKKKG